MLMLPRIHFMFSKPTRVVSTRMAAPRFQIWKGRNPSETAKEEETRTEERWRCYLVRVPRAEARDERYPALEFPTHLHVEIR